MARKLRLILGDQLNYQHSWFQETDSQVVYLLMEMKQELTYVKHHIQKVVGFFKAMRAFKEWLESEGHEVIYYSLDHKKNKQSLTDNLSKLIEEESITTFEYLLPDEYRLDEQLKDFCDHLSIDSDSYDTEHFLTERSGVANFFKKKKTYLMENFYRMMRKKYDLLMEDEEPIGEQWNYDEENRNKYKGKVPVPDIPSFEHDVQGIIDLLDEQDIATIGQIDAKRFSYPTSREEACALLKHFTTECLPHFGTYEDAMHTDHPYLFHSRLSFALNTKMLHPLEVCKAAIETWEADKDTITLAQVEGFVRQIIGWREFMRGIYWEKMPDYKEKNYFSHEAPLPDFYWTGNTKMNCLSHAITQSLENAYAHHIQRLMLTGNFALLLGVHPDEVDQWYLGIYIDAIEWVEITNTRGMSQFADGGLIATKPYVSSANYIHKMSNYCKDCSYDYKSKYGEKACPFNSLYWDFLHRHQDQLGNNGRMGMMYSMLKKMDEEERDKILAQAAKYKEKVNDL
ncbi:MAG: cryptochrome/photolyase family protein [Thermonemataceae bacterium]